MERHGVASRVGESLEYQEEFIAEFLKPKKPKPLKHQNQEPFHQDT